MATVEVGGGPLGDPKNSRPSLPSSSSTSSFVSVSPAMPSRTILLILLLFASTAYPVPRTVLFRGWEAHRAERSRSWLPRTENYYAQMKPEAVVEIQVDEDDDDGWGDRIVEHSSITTSIASEGEYRASCVKEPGCRWECEPRQDELPPDCDCVCFYTDAKWDSIP